MATLRANGQCLVELVLTRSASDNADADAMTREDQITLRAMSSGYVLRRRDSVCDFGTGQGPRRYPGNWTRAGRIKAALLTDLPALSTAMAEWADAYRAKGWTAEITA